MLWFILSCILGVSTEEGQMTISLEHTKAIHSVNNNNALKSSVKLSAFTESGYEIAHGSGNYFKIGGLRFILTAAHNIVAGTSLEIKDGHRYIKTEPIAIDSLRDIAIIIPVQELRNATAVEYRTNTDSDTIGKAVVYAGYPADLGKSAFVGTVANDQMYTMIIQSFALPGSSGSVVFDNKGRALAIISALKLGMYEFNPFPQMHATLVYCQKLRDYNRHTVKELIVRWIESRSAR